MDHCERKIHRNRPVRHADYSESSLYCWTSFRSRRIVGLKSLLYSRRELPLWDYSWPSSCLYSGSMHARFPSLLTALLWGKTGPFCGGAAWSFGNAPILLSWHLWGRSGHHSYRPSWPYVKHVDSSVHLCADFHYASFRSWWTYYNCCCSWLKTYYLYMLPRLFVHRTSLKYRSRFWTVV